MSGLALPVFGVVFVFVIVLPLAALVAKGMLRLIHRRDAAAALHGPSALRYALLVGHTALPIAWLISACVHQAEAGTSPEVCATHDVPGMLCPEVALFAAALVACVAMAALPRLVREQRAARSSRSPDAVSGRARIAQILRRHSDLGCLEKRLVVTENPDEPIATRGVFSPRLVIHSAFVRDLDDDALLGALKHEAEHVRGRDPFRYFIAWWALAANPLGRWLLGPELTRWIVTREIHCDRGAVLGGASAPALAQALVTAARFPGCHRIASAALGASDARVLKLRVGLLMAYAEREPEHCCRTPALRVAACALLLALTLPHALGAAPVDAIHRAAEGAADVLAGR